MSEYVDKEKKIDISNPGWLDGWLGVVAWIGGWGREEVYYDKVGDGFYQHHHHLNPRLSFSLKPSYANFFPRIFPQGINSVFIRILNL